MKQKHLVAGYLGATERSRSWGPQSHGEWCEVLPTGSSHFGLKQGAEKPAREWTRSQGKIITQAELSTYQNQGNKRWSLGQWKHPDLFNGDVYLFQGAGRTPIHWFIHQMSTAAKDGKFFRGNIRTKRFLPNRLNRICAKGRPRLSDTTWEVIQCKDLGKILRVIRYQGSRKWGEGRVHIGSYWSH